MVKLDVSAPEALLYPTNVSQKEQTLVGNLRLVVGGRLKKVKIKQSSAFAGLMLAELGKNSKLVFLNAYICPGHNFVAAILVK